MTTLPKSKEPVSVRFDPRLLVILAAGLILGLPCLWYGFPFYGDDSINHVLLYKHFSTQLWQGDLYPQWLLNMNGGFGSPSLFVHGPIPCYLTSVFSLISRGGDNAWRQLGFGAVTALVASGICFYIWVRRFTGPKAAVVAAVVYLALPYHLNLDLYTRAAFAELWTFAWMPLVLHCIDRVVERRRLALLSLSLSYALLVMTHLPVTLMFSPFALIYALVVAEPHSRIKIAGITVAGMILGTCLSAIYLIPALALQKFSFLSEATAGHYFFGNWFLFANLKWTGPQSAYFWFTLEAAALACVAFAIVRSQAWKPLAIFWLTTALFSLFMMSPLSDPVWKLITVLQRVQFPWRFNTVLSLAAASLVAFALASSTGKAKVLFQIGLMVLVTIWIYDAGRRAWAAYPVNYADQAVIQQREKWLAQDRELNELRPRWVASIEEKELDLLMQRIGKSPGLPMAALQNERGTVTIREWKPQGIVLDVDSTDPGRVRVSQFYFPGWKARTDTGDLEVRPSIPGGLVRVSVPSGRHQITIERKATAPEVVGRALSAGTVIVLLALTLMELWRNQRKNTAATSRVLQSEA
jgi:6-pyruvoyl-tetrahydropterin synthase related domain